jgi:glyoxylase-like metal-dependent hydrolase (beta-lactamase superfamily II)
MEMRSIGDIAIPAHLTPGHTKGSTSYVTKVASGSTLVAFGEAGGPAPPFHGTLSTFAPVAQLGYKQNLACADWLWGTKFAYKYLGLMIVAVTEKGW